MSAPPFWELLARLQAGRFVDLTHAFDANSPHCEAFAPAAVTTLYDHAPARGTLGEGFLAHQYTLVGQWGTHVDAGAHFVPGRRFVDEIPVREMMLPLVVIDVSARVDQDPDYCMTLEDVHEWEALHGRVPAGAFVAMCTGWSRRWPSQERMFNRDANGVAHFPGWSQAALKLLRESRGVQAFGHETTDTDGGLAISKGDTSMEHYLLGTDAWQIELMANLSEIPPAGSIVVASWPKPRKGAGFPARVFAISPPH